MRLARLQSLPEHGLGLDTETWAISKGSIPPVVCGSVAWLDTGPTLHGAIVDKHDAIELFVQTLEDPDKIIVGANIPFDFIVVANELAKLGIDAMPAIFKAYAEGRVFDLQLAEMLYAIGIGFLGKDPRNGGKMVDPETGKDGWYSLSIVVDYVLGRADAKANDEYRVRYHELDGIPLEQWPPSAVQYPIDDAKNTLETALAQAGHLPKTRPFHNWDGSAEGAGQCIDCGSTRHAQTCLTRERHINLHDLQAQCAAAFCLNLGATWGFRVDQRKVDLIERHAIQKRNAHIAPFIEAGVIREDGSVDQAVCKRLIALAYGCEEDCTHCNGTGRLPHPVVATLRCGDCKGRCQPWKAGGKLKEPTVANCDTCKNTGRVPHPIQKTVECELEDGTKTCCGTGLVLHEGVPRSEGGSVSFSRDAMNESGDEFCMSYGEFLEDGKILKDYVPYLRTARVPIAGHAPDCGALKTGKGKKKRCMCPGPYRDVPLTLFPQSLLETGRCSYSGYIQLFPRRPGFTAPVDEVIEVADDYVLQPGERVYEDEVVVDELEEIDE